MVSAGNFAPLSLKRVPFQYAYSTDTLHYQSLLIHKASQSHPKPLLHPLSQLDPHTYTVYPCCQIHFGIHLIFPSNSLYPLIISLTSSPIRIHYNPTFTCTHIILEFTSLHSSTDSQISSLINTATASSSFILWWQRFDTLV